MKTNSLDLDLDLVGKYQVAGQNKSRKTVLVVNGTPSIKPEVIGADRNQNRFNKWKSATASVSASSISSIESDSESRTSIEDLPRSRLDGDDINVDQAFGYDYTSYLSGQRWIDMVLMAWHLIVLVTAVAAVIVAAFIRFSFVSYIKFHLRGLPGYKTYLRIIKDPRPNYDLHFYSHVNELTHFFMTVNILYIVCTLLYMTFFTHRNPLTLPGLTLFTGVLFMLEGAFVSVLYDPGILQDEAAVKRLQAKLHSEYKTFSLDEFSVMQDHISVWLKCCGIVDAFDFHNVTLHLYGKTLIQVPPSCCKRHVFEEGIDAVVTCIKKGDAKFIYRGGCMDAYMEWIQEVCHFYVTYTWVHLIDCCIHAALYKRRISLIKHVLTANFGEITKQK